MESKTGKMQRKMSEKEKNKAKRRNKLKAVHFQ